MRDEWSGRRIEAYRSRGYSPDRIANLIANSDRVTWGYHARIHIEQRTSTLFRKQPPAETDTAPGREGP